MCELWIEIPVMSHYFVLPNVLPLGCTGSVYPSPLQIPLHLKKPAISGNMISQSSRLLKVFSPQDEPISSQLFLLQGDLTKRHMTALIHIYI